MKKTKQIMAFEQLEAEMEMIERNQLISFKGGGDPTGVIIDPSGNIDAETLWSIAHPIAALSFSGNAYTAQNLAATLFSGNAESLWNGAGDAFRHAYWSALNARSQNATLAGDFGLAHENSSPDNPVAERNMDIRNNNYGIALAAAHPTWTEAQLRSNIFKAAVSGLLVTLR
ncbi:DUF6973 domain-containing protein [Pedobacter miscanthi]|uniref:DUF6973 domain-containing protein n=1 Tax=Pedobacter miscanthi TaxID=2259170 RepID=A0A366L3X2_9SPHI|nr:hypothetical protein [Pedobacter miscanthi]RBQ07842.1 hypothetical protein DRW42_09565 [Pedobacter miscanthi]